MAERETDARVKSVKLPEEPDLREMLRGHGVLQTQFDTIVSHDGDLDLAIYIEEEDISSLIVYGE